MLVELPVFELLGDRVGRAEVDHVEGSDGDHLWDAALAGGGQAGGAGGQDAADQFVGQFRGGDVEHSGNQAIGDQALHRFAAVAGGVEYEHFIAGRFQDLSRVFDARCRHTEHRGGDQRLVFSGPLAPVFGGEG